MEGMKHVLVAEITADEPKRVEPLLTEIVSVNAILRTDTGFKTGPRWKTKAPGS